MEPHLMPLNRQTAGRGADPRPPPGGAPASTASHLPVTGALPQGHAFTESGVRGQLGKRRFTSSASPRSYTDRRAGRDQPRALLHLLPSAGRPHIPPPPCARRDFSRQPRVLPAERHGPRGVTSPVALESVLWVQLPSSHPNPAWNSTPARQRARPRPQKGT